MKAIQGRRKFLKIGLGSGLGAGAALSVSPKALSALLCNEVTPEQTSGPFYPGEAKFQNIQDLTWVPKAKTRALGEVIYIKGVIQDTNCRPIENANIEIWQACASGKYNHSRDPNPAPIDPNFRYWGEAFTSANGEFMFKTIVPGAYPAAQDWVRPPHIHVRVSALGYRELITQMYFKGNPLNDIDQILLDTPADERERLVVEFNPSPADLEPDTKLGNFTIILKPVRS